MTNGIVNIVRAAVVLGLLGSRPGETTKSSDTCADSALDLNTTVRNYSLRSMYLCSLHSLFVVFDSIEVVRQNSSSSCYHVDRLIM